MLTHGTSDGRTHAGLTQANAGRLVRVGASSSVPSPSLEGTDTVIRATACPAGKPLPLFDHGGMEPATVGQGLHPNEEVYLCGPSGQRVRRRRIGDAYEDWQATGGTRDWYTWTYSDLQGGVLVRRVTDVVRQNRQGRFLRITTGSGRSVIVTEAHALVTRANRPGGFRAYERRTPIFRPTAAGALETGQRIAIAQTLPCRVPDHVIETVAAKVSLTIDVMQLAGLWVGDGSLNYGKVRISCSIDDPGTLAFLGRLDPTATFWRKELRRRRGPASRGAKPGMILGRVVHDGGRGVDVSFNDWTFSAMLHMLGVSNRKCDSWTKRVPAWMFGSSTEMIAAFLRGYFTADGSATKSRVEASTRSPGLAMDVVLLMARIGILARIERRSLYGTPIYRVFLVKGREVLKFAKRVGFLEPRKTAGLQPERLLDYQYDTGRSLNGVFFDEVKTLDWLDDDDPHCYDLAVDDTAKFVSGGVVVHSGQPCIRGRRRTFRKPE